MELTFSTALQGTPGGGLTAFFERSAYADRSFFNRHVAPFPSPGVRMAVRLPMPPNTILTQKHIATAETIWLNQIVSE